MDADKIAAARSKRHAHATLNFASGEMQRADRYKTAHAAAIASSTKSTSIEIFRVVFREAQVALANGEWTSVSSNRVVLEFIRAERDALLAQKRAANPNLISDQDLATLLDNPNLDDLQHNQRRLRLLYAMRNIYMGEIPIDTAWYEVRSVTDDDIHNLYVTRHQTWTHQSDNNELRLVAARKDEPATAPPDRWKRIILWGHERAGPFTILEGNHRLVGYVRNIGKGLNIPVFVGLSQTNCYWHPLDQQTIVGNRLRRRLTMETVKIELWGMSASE
jgi:hypothetical protein